MSLSCTVLLVILITTTKGVLTAPTYPDVAGQRSGAGHKVKLSRRSLNNLSSNHTFMYRHANQEVVSVQAKYKYADPILAGGIDLPPQPNYSDLPPVEYLPPPPDCNAPPVVGGENNSTFGDATELSCPPTNKSRFPLTDIINAELDLLYFGSINVGTPPQELTVDIDTGSADLWVPVRCPDCVNKQFKPERSSTYRKGGKKFSVSYGSGDVSGTLATDTVSVGGLTVSNQAFGAVNKISSEWNNIPVDGLIGMAFGAIARSRRPTFFENLLKERKLAAPIFSVHLQRNKQSGSELCLGCYDYSKTTGPLTWVPVKSKTYWSVEMDGYTVSGRKILLEEPLYAAIDTGTTLIYLPAAKAAAFYQQIPGSQSQEEKYGPEYFSYPCSSELDVGLVLGGKAFNFNAVDFNQGRVSGESSECIGGILAMGDDFPSDLAIIGDEFLKSWYTVFDYSGGARIGFSPSINNRI